MSTNPPPEQVIRLFQTSLHECGYYPERLSRSVLLDPSSSLLAAAYPNAIDQGFRRSGTQIYRPNCPDCSACIATRIPVSQFHPDRSQRRCLARNHDLQSRLVPAHFSEEHFALYQRYLQARHSDGPMAQTSPEDFSSFLIGNGKAAHFLDVRWNDRLIATAVTDVLPQGYSAVYTFYEPDLPERSLGTFCILQQIALAIDTNRPFLYLGYWIKDHPKMDYKRRFKPLEALLLGQWRTLE